MRLAFICTIFLCSQLLLSQQPVATTAALRPMQRNGKWGYVDAAGNFAISPKYFAAEPFKEGYALVTTRKPWVPFGEEYGEFRFPKVTWIDVSGREIHKPIVVRRASSFSEGLAAVVPNAFARLGFSIPKTGYINTNGEWAIKPESFEEGEDFSEGVAAVRCSKNCSEYGKWGYIRPGGAIAIPFRFKVAFRFVNGEACVKDGQGWQLIRKDGSARHIDGHACLAHSKD
jgi:hypothetical protein